MPYRDKQDKNRNNRIFYHYKRTQLILVLSDGVCLHCGSSENLQIEHPKGAGWEKEKYSSPQRVRLYWKEFWSNIQLSVLCGKCNNQLSTNGRRDVKQLRFF